MTTLEPPKRGRPPLGVRPQAPRHLTESLRAWPHVLHKVGPECNMLLALLGERAMAQSEIKAQGLQPRLGLLIFPHGLATLISRGIDPRHEITPKGVEYLRLLRHAGFLPPTIESHQ